MALWVAVDIGGTFTDLLAYDPERGTMVQAKSPTTPRYLSDALFHCLEKLDVPPAAIALLVHGTTIAINTAIEHTGARTTLVVTAGTRDIYAIGRGNRPEAYHLFFRRPEPLVPRHRTVEVRERMLATGEAWIPLEPQAVTEAVNAVTATHPEAVAVALLHAWANPQHEVMLGEALKAALGPDCFVSLSHRILRQYGEYERISTTVLNAYVGPRVRTYLVQLSERLRDAGMPGPLLIMQSNGGVMTPEAAIERPVMLMESGPVGGIIASAEVGRTLGFSQLIAFDMGGTTAKASLIQDGQPTMTSGYYIGGYASGHPAMVPVVEVVEVGAGGGSIAWIDEVGALKVGPQSAGADPGPIAYGRGGQKPTITDANVALGRIGAESFLGGEMPLDAQAAQAGIAAAVARPLGLHWVEAAQAIVAIAVHTMSLAVRQVSVERGHDPREYALLASGGAGPLHALAVARELSIPTVIVPRFPGHFSAFGMLWADHQHDFVRTYYRRWEDLDLQAVWETLRSMVAEAQAHLHLEDVAERVVSRWALDMRYVGQEFTLAVPVSDAQLRSGDRAAIRDAFDALHERHYSHHAPDEPVEVVNLRATIIGLRPKPPRPRWVATESPRATRRLVYLFGHEPVSCPVWWRDSLPSGFRVEGPAVIEEYASTTLLFPQDVAEVAQTGELIIAVGGTTADAP
ncbi:MAG: hydantoinase/oxoprolinase family protein [Firmicutes bacterium]|nr:hydantoinase/oxoprolinase family protein [Alicyclobacillaceae bacterium]MCL6498351.1 hydantoinase/oxoprolinase family protein [Bacillota bacterium]